MYCSSCRQLVPSGAKFCTGCGVAAAYVAVLDPACRGCGTKLPAGAQFCLNCGTQVGLVQLRYSPNRVESPTNEGITIIGIATFLVKLLFGFVLARAFLAVLAIVIVWLLFWPVMHLLFD